MERAFGWNVHCTRRGLGGLKLGEIERIEKRFFFMFGS